MRGKSQAGTYWSKQRRCSVWGHKDIFLSQNPLYQVQVGRYIPIKQSSMRKNKNIIHDVFPFLFDNRCIVFKESLEWVVGEGYSLSAACTRHFEVYLDVKRICWGEQKASYLWDGEVEGNAESNPKLIQHASDVSGSNKNELFHRARGHLQHLRQQWIYVYMGLCWVQVGWRCLTGRKYVWERRIMSKLLILTSGIYFSIKEQECVWRKTNQPLKRWFNYINCHGKSSIVKSQCLGKKYPYVILDKSTDNTNTYFMWKKKNSSDMGRDHYIHVGSHQKKIWWKRLH